jgi:hypothetical protein
MNFGVNKPKIFDVQTTSFSEILLVILFFLLIFNIDGSQQVEGLKVEIKILNEKNDELTKENKELKKLMLQKDEQIDKLEKEIAAWKQKFILVNKENVLLKSELKRIKLELARTKKDLKDYQNKYGKLDGDDIVNFCRIGNNDVFPVLNILANKRQFIITPLWNKQTDSKYIKDIPGLNRVNNKLTISHSSFKRYFTPTYNWGQKQVNNCRFKVRLKIDKSITKASVFDYVSNEVGRHFYKIRVK